MYGLKVRPSKLCMLCLVSFDLEIKSSEFVTIFFIAPSFKEGVDSDRVLLAEIIRKNASMRGLEGQPFSGFSGFSAFKFYC